MIFRIPEGLEHELSSSPSAQERFRNFIHGAKGHHLILGSSPVLTKLLSLPCLGPSERNVLRHSLERAAQYSGYLQLVQTYAELSVEDVSEPQKLKRPDQDVIRFPLRWFSHPERSMKTVVIAEDLVDAKLYELMGQVVPLLLTSSRFPGLACEFYSGGGGSTARAFGEKVRERLVLTVVDSDRKYVGDSLGDTARSVLDAVKDTDSVIGRCEVLEARSIENVLPDRFYSSLKRSNGAAMQRLLPILTESAPPWRMHLGIRDGLEAFVRSKLLDQVESDSNAPEINALLMNNVPVSCKSCSLTDCSRGDSCRGVVLDGMGKGLVRAYLEFTETRRRAEVAADIALPVRAEWERIGKQILDWCCCAPYMFSD